jgi:hypothetical protein
LAAWSLADRRLVDSIIVLSKDPSQATSRRLQFLGFLTRYVNPHVVIDNNARGPGGGLALVELTDAIPFVGNQPIDQPASDRAYAAIVWMSTNDPNAETRRLAAAVAQQLKW